MARMIGSLPEFERHRFRCRLSEVLGEIGIIDRQLGDIFDHARDMSPSAVFSALDDIVGSVEVVRDDISYVRNFIMSWMDWEDEGDENIEEVSTE